MLRPTKISPRLVQRLQMYLAAQNGHVAVVRLLCEARGNIDQPKTDGATPILIAAQAGRAAFVQLQCDAGANTPVLTLNVRLQYSLQPYMAMRLCG